jgi:acyl-coenzyme A thioesterase PaaI-like protein
MALGATLSSLLSPESGSRNLLREAWDRLSHVPGGKLVFSKLVGRTAPYTGTIDARVEELGRGHARVSMADGPGKRNHLRSVHAVALVNLAEVTGNAALAYSLPDDARFIVAGLSIEYVKKARGTITATSDCPVPETSARQDFLVHVSMRDASGDEVARATLRSLVGPKR